MTHTNTNTKSKSSKGSRRSNATVWNLHMQVRITLSKNGKLRFVPGTGPIVELYPSADSTTARRDMLAQTTPEQIFSLLMSRSGAILKDIKLNFEDL
ncbi:MAG TPA: hypothetical protein VHP83_20490 [Aggregatilineaceae bacterium]|nr:hypothetical protein [Aggregatilineaceae bacterium]